MFDSLCSFPLSSDIFAQAVHPSKPLLATGLASGHVELHRLPIQSRPDDDAADQHQAHPVSRAIDTIWRTRRHNPSCRALVFSTHGDCLYSAGTDGLVKRARTDDGRVVQKFAVPGERKFSSSSTASLPQCLTVLPRHAGNVQDFAVGQNGATSSHDDELALVSTDGEDSSLFVFDPRLDGTNPAQIHEGVHEDYITSITPLPSSAGVGASSLSTQILTTGGTTVAVLDTRIVSRGHSKTNGAARSSSAPRERGPKGVLVRSEDQDEELLCSTIVTADSLSRPRRKTDKGPDVSGDLVVVGGSRGTIRVWDVGVWDDNEVNVRVGFSACNVLASHKPTDILQSMNGQDGLTPGDPSSDDETDSSDDGWRPSQSNSAATNLLAAGFEDSSVRFVDFTHMLATSRMSADGTRKGGRPKVLKGSEVAHFEDEEVNCLSWLTDGRLVSGGGAMVKVWEERAAVFGGGDGDANKGLEDVDGDVEAEDADDDAVRREQEEEEEDSDSESSDEDSYSDKAAKKRKKKRKRGKEAAPSKKKGNRGTRTFNFEGIT